jgi:hypothetical protein
MSEIPSSSLTLEPPQPTRPSPEPPEPTFWEHYSPHHEFPISTLLSVGVYALLAVLLGLLAWLVGGGNHSTEPIPIVSLDMTEVGPGGAPGGVAGPGDNGPAPPIFDPPVPPKRGEPGPKIPQPSPSEGPTFKVDPNAPRTQPVTGDQLSKLLEGIEKNVPGSSNGPSGMGPGPGGKGGRTVRTDRLRRWHVEYQFAGGADHLHKLRTIGCQIALPVPGDDTRVDLVRDLNRRPVQLDRKTVAEINRLPWFFSRDDPEVIRDLADFLGMQPTPLVIIAFLPPRFEEELLVKEMAYAGRNNRTREDQIEQTTFGLTIVGNSYRLSVKGQTYR